MTNTQMMEIVINGENQSVPVDITIAELLASRGVKAQFCAVERNQHLVPRAQHGQTQLAENDRIEVVTLVGGG